MYLYAYMLRVHAYDCHLIWWRTLSPGGTHIWNWYMYGVFWGGLGCFNGPVIQSWSKWKSECIQSWCKWNIGRFQSWPKLNSGCFQNCSKGNQASSFPMLKSRFRWEFRYRYRYRKFILRRICETWHNISPVRLLLRQTMVDSIKSQISIKNIQLRYHRWACTYYTNYHT